MIIQNINGMENGHSFVDLGLPSGLLWATCNVGADSPEQAGLYFAWGETEGFTAEQVKEGKRRFNYESYKAIPVMSDLTPDQDAAHFNMGGSWRMPTKEEFNELIENTIQDWTSDYNGTGVAGCIITSKVNGNSIFLSAVGVAYGNSIHAVNKYGNYRSSTGNNRMYSMAMYFHKRTMRMDCEPRFYGFPIRGVCER